MEKPVSSMRGFSPGAAAWIILCVFALVVHLMLPLMPWLAKFPGEWVIPLADWINIAMDSFVENSEASYPQH